MGEKQRAGFLGFKRDFVPREESGGFWRQLRAPCQPCQLSPSRAALSPPRKPCCPPCLHPRPPAGTRVSPWPWADRSYPGTALQECLLSFLGGRSSRSRRECGVAEGGPCQAPSSRVQGHRSSRTATFLPVPAPSPWHRRAAKPPSAGCAAMGADVVTELERADFSRPSRGIHKYLPEKGSLQAVLMHECYLRFQSLRNL